MGQGCIKVDWWVVDLKDEGWKSWGVRGGSAWMGARGFVSGRERGGLRSSKGGHCAVILA